MKIIRLKVKYVLFYIYILLQFQKIFLKFKLNKVVDLLDNYIQKILFIHFNSNHPNRIKLVKHLIHSRKFLQNLNLLRDYNDLIFIGDSHVEMYSRNNIYNHFFKNSLAIWLGPCTVLGSYMTQSHNSFLIKIKRFLLLKKISIKNIVFSIGSIDVRVFFYQLIISKSVNNTNELLIQFDKGLDYFISEIALKLFDRKNNKISILKIYNSTLEGEEPKNNSEINKIRSFNPFPTFGSISQRQIWTNKVNDIIKKNCKKYKLNFLELDPSLDLLGIKNFTNDGIHIDNYSIINKIPESLKDE